MGWRTGHRLRRKIGRAIGDFRLIEDGDAIGLHLSGTAAAGILLKSLCGLRRKAPVNFSVRPFVFDGEDDPPNLEGIESDAGGAVTTIEAEDDVSAAALAGCNKLATERLLDEVAEEAMRNLLAAGRLHAEPPKRGSRDGRLVLIDPLIYVSRRDCGLSDASVCPGGGLAAALAETAQANPRSMRNVIAAVADYWKGLLPLSSGSGEKK